MVCILKLYESIYTFNGFSHIGQFPGPTIEADWGDTIRKLFRVTVSRVMVFRLTFPTRDHCSQQSNK